MSVSACVCVCMSVVQVGGEYECDAECVQVGGEYECGAGGRGV